VVIALAAGLLGAGITAAGALAVGVIRHGGPGGPGNVRQFDRPGRGDPNGPFGNRRDGGPRQRQFPGPGPSQPAAPTPSAT
jgi:hypothetical protein